MIYKTLDVNDKRFFNEIADVCKEFIPTKLSRIEQIQKKNRLVFLLYLENNQVIRLNFLSKNDLQILELRQKLEESGINISKLLYFKKTEKRGFLVFSEWVTGTELYLFKPNIIEDQVLFSKFGTLVAKMNMITMNNRCVINADLNLTNIIVTAEKELFIVDHGKLRLSTQENREHEICKLLLKRLKYKRRINFFLDEYKKVFDITNILGECEKLEWRWTKNNLQK